MAAIPSELSAEATVLWRLFVSRSRPAPVVEPVRSLGYRRPSWPASREFDWG